MLTDNDFILPLDGYFRLTDEAKLKLLAYFNNFSDGQVHLVNETTGSRELLSGDDEIIAQLEAGAWKEIEPEYRRMCRQLRKLAVRALENRMKGMDRLGPGPS